MKRIVLLALLLCTGLTHIETASASWTLRRFLVSAGANRGSKDRSPLKYAVSDAEAMARILLEMGGVSPADSTILREPSLKNLQDTLESLRAKIASLREANVRYEVVFYYSGHADQKGLLLGAELFPYQNLRRWMDGLNADLKISILDGCSSGAITRIKGGRKQKAFLVDESSTMRGYAFLTSNTEHEAAQESERVKGSFFTYYLMTGMRGAADVSGDGKVTLDEAYQFAYQETLARTLRTQGGTQHPAYDMNLVGTGNVVITDVRQTSAGLLLSDELVGRLFIRTENNQLVAELQKPAGRAIELGLEPGKYNLDIQRQSQVAVAAVELKPGERLALRNSAFQTASSEQTVSRGGTEADQSPHPPKAPKPWLRTSRIELGVMVWPGSKGTGSSSGVGVSTVSTFAQSSASGVLSYSYRLRPNLAVGMEFAGGYSVAATEVGSFGVSTGSADLYSFTPSVKYYPFKSSLQTPIHPYVKTKAGAYFAQQAGTVVANGVAVRAETATVFGAFVGAGLDWRLTSRLLLSMDGGYHVLPDFPAAIGGKKNYSGGEVSLSIGWQFGKPVAIEPRP